MFSKNIVRRPMRRGFGTESVFQVIGTGGLNTAILAMQQKPQPIVVAPVSMAPININAAKAPNINVATSPGALALTPVNTLTAATTGAGITSSLAYAPVPIANSTVPISSVTLNGDPNFPSPQPIGTTINFFASANGGNGTPMYEFWVKGPATTGNQWQIVQGYSSNSVFAFTPTVPDSYTIGVWVENAGSKAANGYEATTNIPFSILAAAPAIVPPSYTNQGISSTAVSPTQSGYSYPDDGSDSDGQSLYEETGDVYTAPIPTQQNAVTQLTSALNPAPPVRNAGLSSFTSGISSTEILVIAALAIGGFFLMKKKPAAGG